MGLEGKRKRGFKRRRGIEFGGKLTRHLLRALFSKIQILGRCFGSARGFLFSILNVDTRMNGQDSFLEVSFVGRIRELI